MKISAPKKIIALILCAFILSVSLPLSGLAESFDSTPVVYIGGMSENVLYANPQKTNWNVVHNVYSKEFTKQIANIFGAFVVATSDDVDVKSKVPDILNAVNKIMGPIQCSDTGVSQNGSIGVWNYERPISECTQDEIYTRNMKALIKAGTEKISPKEIFWFSYDWRLDPLDSAAKLRDFIDRVEEISGKNRVSLLASAFGGVVVNSYLFAFGEHAAKNIASCVFLNSPLLGNAVIGDFMKGRLARVIGDETSLIGIKETITGEQRGKAFFNYIEADPMGLFAQMKDYYIGMGALGTLLGKIAQIIAFGVMEGEDVHKKLGKAYNDFVLVADDSVYNGCLRDYLKNMPGLWALVPEKDFEAADEFLFRNIEPNAELRAKIDAYRNVMLSTEDTLKRAQADGIRVNIVANYGVPLIPLTISMDDLSDGIESVKYTSAGAVTEDNTDKDLHVRCKLEHNHKSPDSDIDAAYCFLPENTWFIKDLVHNDFTCDSVAQFIVWLLTADTQRNVYENALYPQYMAYSVYKKQIQPYATPGSEGVRGRFGDVDADGSISAADARIVLRRAVGLETPKIEKMEFFADVDSDGMVSASDARLILRYSVGLISVFPVELD